jgi:hypothetical protein
MPDLDLERIARHRTDLGAVATDLTASGTELATRQAELAALRVTGRGGPRALERAEAVRRSGTRRAALHARRRRADGLVGRRRRELLDAIEP